MKLDPSLHFKKSQSVWKKPFGLKVCLSLSEKPFSLHVYQSVTNSLQIAAIKKNMFFDLFFFNFFKFVQGFLIFFFEFFRVVSFIFKIFSSFSSFFFSILNIS